MTGPDVSPRGGAAVATVVVYDPIVAVPWSYQVERDLLAAHAVELVVPTDDVAARDALPEADIVVVSNRLPDDAIALLERCRGILCYSVGMDGVNAEVAGARGIPVRNVPGYCTEEVSDHAVAMLLAVQRSLAPIASATASGDWAQAYRLLDTLRPRRIRGQVAGVIGLGRIGSRVAEKCLGLGMTVIGYDPYLVETPFTRTATLGELLTASDAVLLCAATASPGYLIDEQALQAMRPHSVLVNVARGRLVDETALAGALRSGRLRGAALDVREVEPPDAASDPLAGLDTVLLTPHMAATSDQARADLHRFAADAVLDLLQLG
jgi:D-3-phosphoglycerate dehydrogenase